MSNQLIAGVDEAGRGPLAGPVVAAAAILPADVSIAGLADSKKLTAGRRAQLFEEIKSCSLGWSVAQASVSEILELNILHATMLAMQRAVLALVPTPDFVEVDGNRVPRLPMPARAIVGGDAVVASISAASILAKVSRDRQMQALDAQYPGYGFAQHKGYGTAAHLRALAQLGPTPAHRQGFAPVRAVQQALDLGV